jgi:tetratricopeptide (TPR) repeat protein
MGGVGKTQVAIEYVVQFETEYEGVYWITAESRAQLLSGFVSIANETHCTETASQTQTEVADAVLKWLYKSQAWLLVVDNLDDINIADGYLPRLKGGGGHVLITTRNPNSPDIPAEGLRVDVHEPEEAKDLLLQRSQLRGEIGTGSAAEEEARVIVRSVGYLALAVEQAAAYVRTELAKDIFKFGSIYAAQRKKFLGRETSGNTYYKNTVATTWMVSMNAIENRNPAASQLLRVFAFMNPDRISVQFLEAARNVLSSVLQSTDSATFNPHLAEALADLERFSLIFRPDPDLIRIHRLVQTVIKDQMTTDELDEHRYFVCQVGLSAFPEFDHNTRRTCRNYEGEILAIISEIGEMTSEETARLMGRVGLYFREDGKASEAEPLLSSVCKVFEIMKGKEDSDTLSAMVVLAATQWSLGKVNEAAEMEEKVLEAMTRILGEEHPDTLGTMGNLADLYRSLGKLKEAAEMEEKVLEARTRILGEEHPDTLGTMGNLAISYRSLGKVKEAAELEEKVLEVRTRTSQGE